MSLVSLADKGKVYDKKERFLLNQYLYSIKEESDSNYFKFKEKATQQEDIICEKDDEDKKIPYSLPSASRYDTNPELESP